MSTPLTDRLYLQTPEFWAAYQWVLSGCSARKAGDGYDLRFFSPPIRFYLSGTRQRAVPSKTEMKVRQLPPNYVEWLEPQSANVSSLEELLELLGSSLGAKGA